GLQYGRNQQPGQDKKLLIRFQAAEQRNGIDFHLLLPFPSAKAVPTSINISPMPRPGSMREGSAFNHEVTFCRVIGRPTRRLKASVIRVRLPRSARANVATGRRASMDVRCGLVMACFLFTGRVCSEKTALGNSSFPGCRAS